MKKMTIFIIILFLLSIILIIFREINYYKTEKNYKKEIEALKQEHTFNTCIQETINENIKELNTICGIGSYSSQFIERLLYPNYLIDCSDTSNTRALELDKKFKQKLLDCMSK